MHGRYHVRCACCQSTLDRRKMFTDQEDICAGGVGVRSRGATDGSGKMQLGARALIAFLAVVLLWPEDCSRQIFKKLPYFCAPRGAVSLSHAVHVPSVSVLSAHQSLRPANGQVFV